VSETPQRHFAAEITTARRFGVLARAENLRTVVRAPGSEWRVPAMHGGAVSPHFGPFPAVLRLGAAIGFGAEMAGPA
jgi:hypothetical protein